ncbi:MAG TPA: PilZ domain-containing protein [Polyangia bacterium]|nr:PilZ domain-containing protein [Polyangia bacterium]
MAHNLHTVRLVVSVHTHDFEAFGPDPNYPTVALLGDVALDGPSATALAELSVHYVADLVALEELAARRPLDCVIAGWRVGLADLTMRLRTRLIVMEPALPDGLVDAISRGIDARWAPTAAAVANELRLLRSTRLPENVRHRFVGVSVRFEGVQARLRDLSNDGLAFEVADIDVDRLLPGRTLEDLVVMRAGRVCLRGARAIVRHVAATAPGRYRVGCALKPPPAPAQKSVNQVRDRALCAALVKSGLGSGIVIAPLDGDARDGAEEIALSGGRVDAGRGTFGIDGESALAAHDLVRGQFELAGRLYRFTTVVIERAPLTLKLPSLLEESQQRAASRYRPAPTEILPVEIASPLADAPIQKSIFDLSANGFSFVIDGASDLYPLGLVVDVTLRLPDGPLACAAEVRTLVRDDGRLRCGVELLGLDATLRLRLANHVMRLRFPGIDDGCGLGPEELFPFFRTTGFLPPEKEAVLAPVMDEMRDSYRSLYAQPTGVFKAVVSRDGEGQLVGHVSGVRAYSRTWMSQHLAAQPSKHVAHLLNLGAAEYFGQNPDLEYFKIFFDSYNKWPARVFGGFARMLRDSSQSELRSYRHMILSTAEVLPTPLGIDVLEASPDDLAAVEGYFLEREQSLLFRSDDLTRATLQLSGLNRRFNEVGLYRRRRVLLAMRRNVCLGFALAEVSSPGLNLSEALSAFRLHVTAEGESTQDNVRRALLAAVVPIYRNAGRAMVRGMFAPDEVEAYRRIGANVTEELWKCWTCHRTLYPRFCDYVERLFAVLERRARRA